MKKGTWIILAIVAVLALLCYTTYNSLVTAEQEVRSKWSNVEVQYQRRANLIPNLVNTVKGYAAHEQQTFADVVAARSKALSANVDTSHLTAEQIKEYERSQQDVTSALGRLIAIAEAYPDLKANQNFLELQAQLEGTENRITVARNEYNTAVQKFNVRVVRFPSNIIAKMFGMSEKGYFEADEAASAVPVVEF